MLMMDIISQEFQGPNMNVGQDRNLAYHRLGKDSTAKRSLKGLDDTYDSNKLDPDFMN